MIEDANSSFSLDRSVLNRTSAQLLHGRRAADVSPAYAVTRGVVLKKEVGGRLKQDLDKDF